MTVSSLASALTTDNRSVRQFDVGTGVGSHGYVPERAGLMPRLSRRPPPPNRRRTRGRNRGGHRGGRRGRRGRGAHHLPGHRRGRRPPGPGDPRGEFPTRHGGQRGVRLIGWRRWQRWNRPDFLFRDALDYSAVAGAVREFERDRNRPVIWCPNPPRSGRRDASRSDVTVKSGGHEGIGRRATTLESRSQDFTGPLRRPEI